MYSASPQSSDRSSRRSCSIRLSHNAGSVALAMSFKSPTISPKLAFLCATRSCLGQLQRFTNRPKAPGVVFDSPQVSAEQDQHATREENLSGGCVHVAGDMLVSVPASGWCPVVSSSFRELVVIRTDHKPSYRTKGSSHHERFLYGAHSG
jgi:hypothetical protein